jgi:hypothetical protein
MTGMDFAQGGAFILMGVVVKRIILGILAAGAMSAHANLIVNGSFENNGSDLYANYGYWQTYNSITGWSNLGNKVEIQNNGLFGAAAVAADGAKWLELDRYGSYSITSQSIAAVAGQTYTVSFAYAGRPDAPAGDNKMIVDLNGVQKSYAASNSVYGGALNWTYATFSFTATGSDYITFKDSGLNDSYGMLLDNVVVDVAAVPEPATLGLFGIGLLAIAGVIRARKTRKD